MRPRSRQNLKIESILAGVYSSYWTSVAAFSGFMAIYLSHYGFSDTLVGLTASLISLVAIVSQLALTSFLDARPHARIRRAITAVYFVFLALVAALALLPMPTVAMLLVYALAGGLSNTLPALFNAQAFQFINIGVPLRIGWSRGMGAITYAVVAFYLGRLLESATPGILMPICLVLSVIAIAAVLLVPHPQEAAQDEAIPSLAWHASRTSLRRLLASNRVLRLFLLSGIFMNAGQSNVFIFLTRIVEANGGGKADLGLAMFIQAGVEMPAMLLSSWLLARFRARAILTFSLMAYVLKHAVIYAAGGLAGVYLAMALSLLCFGLYGVTAMFFANDAVRHNEKARAQALVSATGAVSAMVGNLTAGWVVDTYGIGRLNLLCLLLQVVAFALMLLCAGLQARQEKHPEAHLREA